jgi:hypothetical protein
MAEGAVWEYLAEVASPTASGAKQVQTGKEIVRCDGKETINGREYWKCSVMMVGFRDQPDGVVYFRKSGEGFYAIEGGKQNLERLYLALPAVVGKNWVTSGGKNSFTNWIEAIETADVYRRKYAGYVKLRYQIKDQAEKVTSDATIYSAPGIGSVKATFRFGEVWLKLSLEKYSPK